MTKSDLKAGYVIEFENGEFAIVMPSYKDMIYISKDDLWGSLDRVNFEYNPSSLNNIVRVYGYSLFEYRTLCINAEHRPLLWERKTPKELTVEEIEELLGYEIKIVNNKGE